MKRALQLQSPLAHALLGAAAVAVAVGPVPPFAALLLGAAVAAIAGHPAWAPAAARKLLAASIVALGGGMELSTVLAAGWDSLGITAITLALTFSCGWWLGGRLGIPRDVVLLVSAGTAICGGSAIAAVAPTLRARSADVAAALGVVFLLNAIALALFPVLGRLADMDAQTFGAWCAFAIHDTSSVVGAASSFGTEALETATIGKMARTLWILPVGLVMASFRPRAERTRLPVPWFLLGFLAAAAAASWIPGAAPLLRPVATWAKSGLQLALFGVGLSLSWASLKGLGPRPLALGVALWTLLALVSWVLV